MDSIKVVRSLIQPADIDINTNMQNDPAVLCDPERINETDKENTIKKLGDDKYEHKKNNIIFIGSNYGIYISCM
ncbi:hypothetical protein [Alkaliphilus sp. B6464]|uniref:hypothetical protein n=1 Tax=Alkaliphilus sp. B6464 TaxID=2731219 RepID=UPI001BAA45F8|nr:hypothetical protein [Alkaliphilus sp. B6464]QUH19036.1 hypothetical protein HYG84_03485 [Alkaliphilus sp. B6464]